MDNWEYDNATDPPQFRYIGYVVDLVHKLSQVVGFEYVIKPVADGSYGYQRSDESWDGIIGELLKGVRRDISNRTT